MITVDGFTFFSPNAIWPTDKQMVRSKKHEDVIGRFSLSEAIRDFQPTKTGACPDREGYTR